MKKAKITQKAICFLLVFVILTSAMPVASFAVNDSNNSTGNAPNRSAENKIIAMSGDPQYIKFLGTAVTKESGTYGMWWVVTVAKVISGPLPSEDTINVVIGGGIMPKGYVDSNIKPGDKVEVYGRDLTNWVSLTENSHYIKRTDVTAKCGKITNWETACTNVQLGGKFGAEMDFDNLMAGGYRFKGIVRVRSPTDEVYSGENQPRFVPSSPNNHGKFAGGNTLYVTIPEGASTGKYDVKLELWNADTNTLCDDTGWKENIFTVKDGGAVSEIVFIGTAIEGHEASGMPGEASYWIVSVDELISGPQPCSNQIKVITGQAIGPLPWGYVDPSIKESDKVKVYGKYDENLYGSDECAVWLYESEDYYIKKSSSCGSIKITSVSPPPGTTLNAGDTVTFTVNVDYDLEESDYGKIRLSVNQYTTGTTDKEYNIGTFEPHSGSYTFTHTETIGDGWENVYVSVTLYAAKQGEPLPAEYTDFDYKQYPIKGKGGGSLLHFDLDYKGTEPASGEGDGNDLHQLYAQVGQSFVMYTFYKEGNAGNQYIVRAYPEWDKKSFILNSDNDGSISELAQEMSGHRYDAENYIVPSVPGKYKIKVVYSNSATPPTWDNYNRLLGEFTVIVEGGGDCFEIVPSDHWIGEYYNNKNLEGSPVMVRDDGTGYLNFDWDRSSPSTACGIGSDFFSVRWTRTLNFDSDTWRFTATTDDGMRVYVDGSLIIDRWFNQVATTYTVDIDLTAGTHTIKVEYYEYDLTAVAKLSWEKGDSKEIIFTGTATDYWVSGGQIHHWTVLVDEVISGPQPCEDQVDITAYDSEFPPPWGYVDPNLNVGDQVKVYVKYYDGDCSAMHLHGSTDYYIKRIEPFEVESKPDLAVYAHEISISVPGDGCQDCPLEVELTARVHNIGDRDAYNVYVNFTSETANDGNAFFRRYIGSIEANGHSDVAGNWPVNDLTNSVRVSVYTTPEEEAEEGKNNNEESKTFGNMRLINDFECVSQITVGTTDCFPSHLEGGKQCGSVSAAEIFNYWSPRYPRLLSHAENDLSRVVCILCLFMPETCMLNWGVQPLQLVDSMNLYRRACGYIFWIAFLSDNWDLIKEEISHGRPVIYHARSHSAFGYDPHFTPATGYMEVESCKYLVVCDSVGDKILIKWHTNLLDGFIVIIPLSRESLSILATCPIDLRVIDPEGKLIDKESYAYAVLDARYTETDINGDGDPDDQILIPDRKIGDYKITVIPEPDAKPTDTYTLEVTAGDTTTVLAENVPISEIPAEPYIFKSVQNQPPHNPTLTPDKPEPQPTGTAITWTAAATDPDGDTLYYRFRIRDPATGNSWTLKRDWSTDSSWTWYTNSVDIGDTDISVWIRDGHHASASGYDIEKIVYDYQIGQEIGPCKLQITSNPSLQDRPSLVYVNGNYYVAYQSHEKGYGIYIKQFDSQWNFKKKVEVVSGSAYYDSPSLLFANNKLYVAYITNAKGANANDYDIIVKEYNPSSLSCTKGAKYLTSLQSCQDLPAIYYKDGYFYMAYQSWERGDGDIFIKKFDSDLNMLKKVQVTTKSSVQDRPSITYANGYFYVAYFSEETGYYDIFVKRLDSNLNLASWKEQITTKSSYQSYPFITFVNNQFVISYASTESGTLGIYMKKYDSNWNFIEKTKVIDSSAYERRPSHTWNGSNFWVAYVYNQGDSKDWNIFAIRPDSECGSVHYRGLE